MLKSEEYTIVAQSVGGEHYLLLPAGEDIKSVEAKGRILDTHHSTLSPPLRLHSVLKQGYWEPFNGQIDDVHSLVTSAKELEAPATVR